MDETTRDKYKRLAIILICVITGFLARLIYLIRYPVQPRDSYGYEMIVNEWEKLGTVHSNKFFTPLSVWILKIPHHFFGYDVIKGGVIINFTLGILLIILATSLAYKIFDNNKVSLVVGLTVATHPLFIYSSCVFLRENTYLFFSMLLTMSIVAYYRNHGNANLLAAGFFGALALLCRLEGIEILVIVFLILFFRCLFRRISFKTAVKNFLFFMVAFLATFFAVYQLLNVKINDLNEIGTKLNFEDFNM